MPDKRDILEVLKLELNILEHGDYAHSERMPWRPTSIFLDSPSCINFRGSEPRGSEPHGSEKRRPCSECLLYQFVPAKARTEKVPCHHIPLNEAGQTVYTMERQDTQAELEEAVKQWLRSMIERIEQERAA